MFIVNIATDVGSGKVNTGVNFYSRPISTRQVLVAAEELYTAELREFNQRTGKGAPNAKFTCVLALVMTNPSSAASVTTSSTATSSANEKWQELTDPSQLYPNCQLYVFDTNSPAPERGIIPRAQLVVDADRISSVAVSSLRSNVQKSFNDREGSAATAASITTVRPAAGSQRPAASTSSEISANPQLGGGYNGPRASDNRLGIQGEYMGTNATPKNTHQSHMNASYPNTSTNTYTHSSQQAAASGITAAPDRTESRRYLFRQLRDRCASLGQGNGSEIPAQSLHGVMVQNEMFFSTNEFAEMTNNKPFLGEREWAELEADFAPVLDVLYDRIAAKTAQRNQKGDDEDKKRAAERMQSKLDDLEEEEARLMARQAAIREEMAKLRRELQRHEQQSKLASDERAKEWDVLSKYVNLKLRQHKLRREELQINHQLSLL